MAKVQHNNRLAKNQRGESVAEQNLSIDDNMLPDAFELERLKNVDPNIITWIMARSEQEQNARLQWNKKQNEIMEYDVKGYHRFNFLALVLGFLLFAGVIGAAVFCIIKGLSVEGTVLGGAAIITGIVFFMRASIQGRDKK